MSRNKQKHIKTEAASEQPKSSDDTNVENKDIGDNLEEHEGNTSPSIDNVSGDGIVDTELPDIDGTIPPTETPGETTGPLGADLEVLEDSETKQPLDEEDESDTSDDTETQTVKPITLKPKIDAIINSFKNKKPLEYATAIKSFVNTCKVTFKQDNGGAELHAVLTAYREEKAFELLTLNNATPNLVGKSTPQQLKAIVTFHTLMSGICDGTKKAAFLKTIDLDRAVNEAGLSSSRHLF